MHTRHRVSRSWSLLLVPFAVACGGGEDGGAGAPAPDGQTAAAVQVANPATITGVVRFTGTPPAAEPIDMSEEPACASKHATPPTRQSIAASPDGALRNVFVYVKEGLQGEFPAAGEAPVLDQNGCIYEPHVLGVQTGQQLTIRNSDGVLHNINASPEQNRGFNISQPTTMDSRRTFNASEIMIPVRCDVHGWMEAYVGVVDHPYFAVTREDGSFTIPNLPPGTYVLEAWHEDLGTQTMNVTVAANESKAADFTYDASRAGTAMVPLGEPIVLHAHHSSSPAGAGLE